MSSSLLYRAARKRPAPARDALTLELSQDTFAHTVVAGAANGAAGSLIVRKAATSGGALGSVATTAPQYTGDADWLTVGSLTPVGDGSYTLGYTVDESGVSAGTHEATFTVRAFGALNSPQTVTVTLTAQSVGTALLAITRSRDDANAVVGGSDPALIQRTVYAANGAPLNGPTITSTVFSGDFSNCATITLVGDTLSVQGDTSAASTDGVGIATVTINDAFAIAAIEYEFHFRVGAATIPANPAVAPTAIARAGAVGEAITPAQVQLSNIGSGGLAGLGTVTAAIVSAPAWVAVSYAPATGLADVTFDSDGLTPDTLYTATLRFTMSAVTPSTLDVPIQLQTTAPSGGPRLLRYALPGGVTQNSTTAAIEGIPTGCLAARPTNWNAAADFTPTTPAAFATALASSASMDNPVIQLTAGLANELVTSTGWTIPARSGLGWLVIRTSAYASLPARGTRVHPTTHAAHLAYLRITANAGVFETANAASRTFLYGIATTDSHSAIHDGHIRIRSQNATLDQSNIPEDLAFEQCVGYGRSAGGSRRWISLRCKRFSMIDCYAYDYKVAGFEAQCVNLVEAGAFYFFDNSFFEAAGECILIGGQALTFNDQTYLPQDMYFRRCRFQGRFEWFTWHPSYSGPPDFAFKNLWEIKKGKRCLLDGCVFDTGGRDAQSGLCVVVKSEDNYNGSNPGARVSITTDVQFIDCHVTNVQRAFALLGNSQPSIGGLPTERVHVLNCLVTNINIPPNNGGSMNELLSRCRDATVEHCTIHAPSATPQSLLATVAGIINPTFLDNVFHKGSFGVTATNFSPGLPSISQWVNYQFTRNVLYAGGTSNNYPPGNFFPATAAAVGFVTPAGGTDLTGYDLLPSSPYFAAAANGRPLGADCARIAAKVAGV